MSCCFLSSVSQASVPDIEQRILTLGKKARDAGITTFVLGLISLFMFVPSFILFGLGTLSPTAFNGLGVIPYLAGTFLSFVALGVVFGTLVFAAITAVRRCQKAHWQGALQRAI